MVDVILMAIRVYPLDVGYDRWRIWRVYTSDEPIFGSLDLGSTSLALPAHPQGLLLWRGQLATPVYPGGSAGAQTMQTLMESLDEGLHQLRIPIPVESRIDSILGSTLVVQPVRVRPPIRDSRGVVSSWTVDWWEVP